MIPSLTQRQLEQQWIKFQFDIAGIRGVLGPMYQAAMEARRAHTFYVGEQPAARIIRALMAPTASEPNGVPDGHAVASGGTYGARVASVAASSVILLTLDTAIQEFAGRLHAGQGANMNAGDAIVNGLGNASERASTLIWAAANNIRHVEEWHRTAASFSNPCSKRALRLREQQNASMAPLARVLDCVLPITDNLAFEVLQLLTENISDHGSYHRVELHALRIGHDLIQRAGLINAPIGVTIAETMSPDAINTIRPEDLIISDGVARTASSLPKTDRLTELTPAAEPQNREPAQDQLGDSDGPTSTI